MGYALAAAGYVVAVPEYRRPGMADEGWAGTFDDLIDRGARPGLTSWRRWRH
jgi:hypothetical protein